MNKADLAKQIDALAARHRYLNALYDLVEGDEEMTANIDKLNAELNEEVLALVNLQPAFDTKEPSSAPGSSPSA
jgi:hypothetical protein